ncbi:MAG: transposase, partial [archaeon]
NKRFVLGIDTGSRTLCAITLFDSFKDKVIKQLYLGRDVWIKQNKISMRRSKLQSLADRGNSRAKKSLHNLKCHESDFVKTRVFQIVSQIRRLAVEYNTCIVTERLSLRKKRLNRNANKRVARIPYSRLFSQLRAVCLRDDLFFEQVNPKHTSQSCPKCSYVSSNNRSNSLFACKSCGFTANADRIASFNITQRASVIAQYSLSQMAVNPSLPSNEGVVKMFCEHVASPEESLTL